MLFAKTTLLATMACLSTVSAQIFHVNNWCAYAISYGQWNLETAIWTKVPSGALATFTFAQPDIGNSVMFRRDSESKENVYYFYGAKWGAEYQYNMGIVKQTTEVMSLMNDGWRLLPGNRPLCQRRWKPAGTTIMRQGLYAPGVPYANGISTPDSTCNGPMEFWFDACRDYTTTKP